MLETLALEDLPEMLLSAIEQDDVRSHLVEVVQYYKRSCWQAGSSIVHSLLAIE